MAEIKTKVNEDSVTDFLDKVDNEQKRNDCYEIIEMMQDITKHPPKMWGTAIIGFASYHYKYDSGHEADMLLVGFSPRKANIALYIICDFKEHEALLQKLGKHKTSKACLYINKLADVDKTVLRTLIKAGIADMRKKYPVSL